MRGELGFWGARLTLIALALTLATQSACRPKAPSSASGQGASAVQWVPIEDSAGGYHVEFPGTASPWRDTVSTDIGTLDFFGQLHSSESTECLINFVDLPEVFEGQLDMFANHALENIRESGARAEGKRTKFGANPAREVRGQDAAGLSYYYLAVQMGRRVYQLFVVAQGSQLTEHIRQSLRLQPGWVRVQRVAQGFSVEVPSHAVPEAQRAEDRGSLVVIDRFLLPRNDAPPIVLQVDTRGVEQGLDQAGLLRALTSGLDEGAKAEVVAPIHANGASGFSVKLSGNTQGWSRLLVVGQTLYMLTVASNQQLDQRLVQHFFDSFVVERR